jgi:glycerophosphoryl diester phosphodiesterase
MRSLYSLIIIFVFSFCTSPLCAQVKILENAHSHNDYKQKHPLTDALNNGFTSIEADIFLLNGKLIVSHISPFFKKSKTLERLYLKPLQDSINKHNGTVYTNNKQSIILLIDIKTNAEKTYETLKPLLEKYSSILTQSKNGVIIHNAVTVVLTGNKPYSEVNKENNRFAFIDQNLLSLNTENKDSTSLFLMASAKYSTIIHWKGKGIMPESEKENLIKLTTLAHQQGIKVRLWASPENKLVWAELLKCGVDFINTDELEELKQFLLEYRKEGI